MSLHVNDGTSFVTVNDTHNKACFDSGMVRSTETGKPRFDLLVPESLGFEDQMLVRFARLMARGAQVHAPRNWEQASGPAELARARSSAFRHFMQWYCSVDDGEDHAAAVWFNIMAAEYIKGRQEPAACRCAGLEGVIRSDTANEFEGVGVICDLCGRAFNLIDISEFN